MARDWNHQYAIDETPWDIGSPDGHLIALVEADALPRGRALEIGAGTGTNAIWLAQHGYDVHAVDLSPLAVERAQAKAKAAGVECSFAPLDILAETPSGGPYDLVFDRGVFHVFDDPAHRATFAARVAEVLGKDGRWVSLIGSTEGPQIPDFRPPRRTAGEVIAAIEPALAIESLRLLPFDAGRKTETPLMWQCIARPRTVPPSYRESRG